MIHTKHQPIYRMSAISLNEISILLDKHLNQLKGINAPNSISLCREDAEVLMGLVSCSKIAIIVATKNKLITNPNHTALPSGQDLPYKTYYLDILVHDLHEKNLVCFH